MKIEKKLPSLYMQGGGSDHRVELETLQATIKLLEGDIRMLSLQCSRLRAENNRLSNNMEERFHEIAILVRMLKKFEPSVQITADFTQKDISVYPTRTSSRNLFGVLCSFFGARSNERKLLKKQIARCEQSGIVDKQWYLTQYPDVAASGIAPSLHFVKFGIRERRKPNPDFDWTLHDEQLLSILRR